MATRTAAFTKLRVQKLPANLNIGTSSDRSREDGEGTSSDIDEERSMVFFIILCSRPDVEREVGPANILCSAESALPSLDHLGKSSHRGILQN